MPRFTKKSLSLFFRNGCERQFVLSLYNDAERENYNLPPRQKSRSALGLAGQAGYEWQDEKISELKDIFGEANVHVNPVLAKNRPARLDLLTVLPDVQEYQFIVEGGYQADTETFRREIGLGNLTDFFGNVINIGETQPDIIQILPPISSVGLQNDGRNLYELAVLPNGETRTLEATDNRLRLRVIDVKLSSEPGANYFAEVVYYSMTLAAWLTENNLDDHFVVVAAAAIWSGKHDASNLAKQFAEWQRRAYQPTPADLALALEDDLEIAVFEVFAPRLRRLLTEQLPALLAQEWQNLNWHVDFRCKGCEFLGYPWRDENGNIDNHPTHCWVTAENNQHLSRIVGLSRGATRHLSNENVTDVNVLATTDAASTVFDEHQSLRAKRSIFPFRANALQQNLTSVIPHSGGDALMPKYPNLHIYVFLDYDLSSAITAAIGLRAFWREPLPFGSNETPKNHNWTHRQNEDEVFLIDRRDLEREREEFLKFLRQLRSIFNQVIAYDNDDTQAGRRDARTQNSTFQIYLWDESQRKHLVRLVGRHLPHILADENLRGLAWLFPPPELLQHPEDATRQSPLTIVSEVINNTVAVPVPHHYCLLDVVQTYKPENLTAPSVHPLYEEPMSDLLPAERIHEWWQRRGNWHQSQELVRETSQKKVVALNLVASRLESDLRNVLSLQSAPPVVRPQQNVRGIAPPSRLWLEFTRLNLAMQSLEAHAIRAMPPHEREAKTKSARLTRRLQGDEEQSALVLLSQSLGRTLAPSPNLFVYQMRDASREVNLKPGDIQYALSPETHFGFLDEHPFRYVQGTSIQNLGNRRRGESFATIGLTEVSIEAIDRINGFIALRGGGNCAILQLEQDANLNFSQNVILDKTHKDFITKKIQLTLQGIGYPASAVAGARTLEALGLPPNHSQGNGAISPASEVLWETTRLYNAPTNRDAATIQNRLQAHFETRNANLDASQWNAWAESLSRRFSLIWGPPGTGKSRTLRAIILGAVLDALENKKTLRLLVTANTNTAIDNVLDSLETDLAELLPERPYNIFRIQSHWQSPTTSTNDSDLQILNLNRISPSDEINDLRETLENPVNISIIGCLPQQLHNLATAGIRQPRPPHTLRRWFDMIILDEASQINIASSTLIFSKLAEEGSCVLAGDDLQLPPIQPADKPLDLENLVGSAYNYFRHFQNIVPASLDVNYRSNETIVELTKLAGYNANLRSNSPNLRLSFVSDIPTERPPDFPAELFWSPEWEKFLDADFSTVCFVYNDEASSQANDFEADSVASLIWLLQNRLADRLLNERQSDGRINQTASTTPYSTRDFWQKAVGVVTPHRAQMAKIIGRLQQVFPAQNAAEIRSAVDTVERFQGQQRDVVIASFGLGDADLIGSEEEFLFNLNRFNVLSSRARAKFIVFITRTLLEHLSNDSDVLAESRFLKQFAETFCRQSEQIQLGFVKNGAELIRNGDLRRR